jgi:general secretion pathway protein G
MISAWKRTQERAHKRLMAHARARRKGAKGGYSLMEILIVLAIMGLLVALVGPQLANMFGGAQGKTATAQIRTLKEALETMNLDIGRYPTQEEGLTLLVQAPGDGVANWNGPYLNKGLPEDPWKRPYVYAAPAEGAQPVVSTLGKDGKPGGTGANEDIEG